MLSSLTPNRITKALDDIRSRCDALPAEDLANLDRDMRLEFVEHFAYQNAQAAAHAAGRISTDEAQLIYAALGEGFNESNGGWRAGISTAEKVTINLAIGDILKANQEVRNA